MWIRRILGVCLIAGPVGLTDPAVGQDRGPKDSDRYEVVDGAAVHGYAGGKEISYEWFPSPERAERAAEGMRKIEVLTAGGGTAKYYDDVQVLPERRRVPRPRSGGSGRPPADPTPSLPRPGDGGAHPPAPDEPGRKPPAPGDTPSLKPPTKSGPADSVPRPFDVSVLGGKRYPAPPPGTEFRVTVAGRDGRVSTRTFDSYAAALKYMNKQNEDPDRRATLRTVEPLRQPRPSAPDGTPVVKLPRVDPGRLKPAKMYNGPFERNPLIGTAWDDASRYGATYIEFAADRKLKWKKPPDGIHGGNQFDGEYTLDGTSLTYRYTYNGGVVEKAFKGEVGPQEITGTETTIVNGKVSYEIPVTYRPRK